MVFCPLTIPQRLVYARLDAQGVPPPNLSIVFCRPSYILLMGRRRLLQLLLQDLQNCAYIFPTLTNSSHFIIPGL